MIRYFDKSFITKKLNAISNQHMNEIHDKICVLGLII